MSNDSISFRISGEPSDAVQQALRELHDALVDLDTEEVAGFRFGEKTPQNLDINLKPSSGPIKTDFCLGYSFEWETDHEECWVFWS